MNSFKRKIFFVITAIILVGSLSFSIATATLSPLTPPPSGGYVVGDILDPGCNPTDLDCLINPASFRGVSYNTSVTTGHNNEVLYLDSSGNLASDANFTRDYSNGNTNILRNFTSSVTQNTVIVGDVIAIDTPTGVFQNGETITDTTSGATATLEFYGAGVSVMVVSNISGVFSSGDVISGNDSGATTTVYSQLPSNFNVNDYFESFDPNSGPTGVTGQISGIVSGGYAYILYSPGSIHQYEILLDNPSSPTKAVGIISLGSNSVGTPVTTGFQSSDNFIAGITGGSAITQSTAEGSVFNGVFDLSPFSGSSNALSTGMIYVGNNDSSTFLINPTGAQLQVQGSSGNSGQLTIVSDTGDFSLSTRPSGGSEYGFMSNNGSPAWYYDNRIFKLPTSYGSTGQVLTDDGAGNLTWSNASSFPDQSGNTGKFLTTDGSTVSWASAGSLISTATCSTNEFLASFNGTDFNCSGIGSLDYIPLSSLGSNNGVATLDANGKIPSSQLAALAINNSFIVNSEAEMLALNAHTGDIAVRTDISASFVLSSENPTNLGDWIQLLWEPTVVSVNGLTGTVNLTTDQINEGSNNLYFTTARANTAITNYLPNQSGNNGRVLSTDGAGNLSWVVQTGGTDGSSPIMLDNSGNLYTGGIGAGQGSSANIMFGYGTGNGATGAYASNFLGQNAGNGATGAYASNFFGYEAGFAAAGASNANFFGYYAGHNALYAQYSNFIGANAGEEAYTASQSNFFGFQAGYNATNAYASNFFGQGSGYNSTQAYASNFIGSSAGGEATYANNANFFGSAAGYQATYANGSNFIGGNAGYQATNAYGSNFFGGQAGIQATNASYSNFFGSGAGQGAINANNSNFFGQNAGNNATDAHGANFFGYQAGINATYGEYSNFFGNYAGSGATNAANANFFGDHAGHGATDASGSNFFGLYAGISATGSHDSNFFGVNAGHSATDAPQANFFGNNAGYAAVNASQSNFFGYQAGQSATDSDNSNFFGYQSGYNATGANNSNFFGASSGYFAGSANNANFFGVSAGYQATNASFSNFFGANAGLYATNAYYSNFSGASAGYQATNASFSNFFGPFAGNNATNANNANFFGPSAGDGATDALYANFIGDSAGRNATNASFSNFFGANAGEGATGAFYSNFLGYQSGYNATTARDSNFIGRGAGYEATNANFSTFIGLNAGKSTPNAANSIFIGTGTGEGNITLDNTGDVNDYSILIGNSASTTGYSNSIALGQSATNTASNQFMIGSTVRTIDTTIWRGAGSTTCTLTTGTGMACSSDERLKTNIENLTEDTLDKLLSVKTVTYNWLQNPTSATQIGFIAQDLEQYFPELVATDNEGMKSVYYAQMTPILVEAVREMNLKITGIGLVEKPNAWRDAISAWLGSVTNGIQKIFAHEVQTDKLCVGNTCVDEQQLQQLLLNQHVGSTVPSPDPITVSDSVPENSSDNNSGDIAIPTDSGSETDSSITNSSPDQESTSPVTDIVITE